MHPRFACPPPGQGSEVTPTSVLTSPCSSSPPPPSPHEAARTVNTAVSARNPRPLGTMALLLFPGSRAESYSRLDGGADGLRREVTAARGRSVREGPGPEVVPDADPQAEQAPGLADQEHHDQRAVDDRLELERGEEATRGLRRDEREEPRELLHQAGQQHHEGGAQERSRDGGHAPDQDHGQVLDRQEQIVAAGL